MRVLIIEDEPELRAQIADTLRQQNYTVDTAGDGVTGLERACTEPYDLLILDIMLPVQDGFAVLREMRAEQVATPVLMLTARVEVEDRVRGLDLGADDYLLKPFSMAELLARIRALLRRSHTQASPLLTVGDIHLDTGTREVTRSGRPVSLTPKEFALLEFLLYNRNRAISRFNLAEHVWGDAFDPFTMSNTIDVHIRNLRRKVDDQAGEVIVTVRGIGYMVRDVQP
ncbi:response regulator transcription factor [uncultured Desulfobulbus sp.]|uniref:response regulator transcription factor n=1 Tax=uncultured Desulfobulbus sp. TaxID=239745 RepID=UPI0026021A3B|nr:response regulator transcription factor [uncultured Desulfobulbus sp.]